MEMFTRRSYLIKRGDFANVYSLYWVYSEELNKALKRWPHLERITYKDAVEYCKRERERRRSDPAFAYLADADIYPLYSEPMYDEYGHIDGNSYIMEVTRG